MAVQLITSIVLEATEDEAASEANEASWKKNFNNIRLIL